MLYHFCHNQNTTQVITLHAVTTDHNDNNTYVWSGYTSIVSCLLHKMLPPLLVGFTLCGFFVGVEFFDRPRGPELDGVPGADDDQLFASTRSAAVVSSLSLKLFLA